MDDTISRVLMGICVWASAMIGFLFSLMCSGNPRVLALGNTFGGGVLLAAGLVHLTNDAIEDFSDASEDSWSKRYDFPWATFFVVMGFIVTLFVEESVLLMLERGEAKHSWDMLNEPFNTSKSLDKDSAQGGREGQNPLKAISTGSKSSSLFSNKRKSSGLSAKVSEVAFMDHGDHEHGARYIVNRGIAISFVFLLAISCHSFLAGLGVGALKGNKLWSGMAAIVAHKGLATFTLATCFIKSGCAMCSLVFYIGFFSLVTPFGIFCGSLISSADNPSIGILVGLAGGSFLYIGVLEVISKEMEHSSDKIYKLLMLLLGCGLMSFLAIWV